MLAATVLRHNDFIEIKWYRLVPGGAGRYREVPGRYRMGTGMVPGIVEVIYDSPSKFKHFVRPCHFVKPCHLFLKERLISVVMQNLDPLIPVI